VGITACKPNHDVLAEDSDSHRLRVNRKIAIADRAEFGALDWNRTSIGRSRNPLTIQSVHEHVKQLCNFFPQSGDLFILDDPAGAAPAHEVLQTAAFLFRHGSIMMVSVV
jgi:hypothetical protein